eukprot:7480874-Lingulodinium_polyedra.AAC.1
MWRIGPFGLATQCLPRQLLHVWFLRIAANCVWAQAGAVLVLCGISQGRVGPQGWQVARGFGA